MKNPPQLLASDALYLLVLGNTLAIVQSYKIQKMMVWFPFWEMFEICQRNKYKYVYINI